MSKQNAFDQKKQAILKEINSLQPDLSPKGTIDELCLPIMRLINSHIDMVTTSSCSGRLSVFAEGTKMIKGVTKVGGKGEGGRWLYVSHDYNKISNWFLEAKKENQFRVESSIDISSRLDGNNRYILYKYEPFILHVKCRDFAMASKLYNVAMSCGFRESGIGSNFLVGIRINIKLDVPIGYVDEVKGDNVLFVDPKYIELLDLLTLTKFEENVKKMQDLYNKIEEEIINEVKDILIERKLTKDEIREKKINEGLARQRKIQEERLNSLSSETEKISIK
ncbi:hypothetical protein TPHA_0K01950 [Tetrapisispora phaffii CBS 4417]|uniref:tRNA wybutosine-synthesizing protein 3 n=1 Tax=Tetrapisispora phaffii (strain ATCC 24235 / CBS 4417 / NBRC 1672 / NRRL Y-8282 / UCD 70-5) TaxID=1071381 RepID=G8BZK0_TETPH|nr:hypothetical protein TPHA_0K01950 [Tetrapisispora phaffii CBS 4417]CCE65328.1 hypothetical protein TPHA_0K01950 [Tetrapisispora phaffii CBS 4417]